MPSAWDAKEGHPERSSFYRSAYKKRRSALQFDPLFHPTLTRTHTHERERKISCKRKTRTKCSCHPKSHLPLLLLLLLLQLCFLLLFLFRQDFLPCTCFSRLAAILAQRTPPVCVRALRVNDLIHTDVKEREAANRGA